MKKTTSWELTEEEQRLMKNALFVYEQLLCGIDTDLDWNPETYKVADDLYLSFCSEASR